MEGLGQRGLSVLHPFMGRIVNPFRKGGWEINHPPPQLRCSMPQWSRTLIVVALLATLGACTRGPVGEPNQAEAELAKNTPAGPPLFEDITAASGIQFTYRNGEDTANHLSILESLGGGVGLIDFDGDGLLDIFLPGGGGFAGADKKDIVGLPCKLYRNLGNGKFQDVTAAVGLDKLAGGRPWFYTHGVAVGDYDCDGWPDLLVTGWGGVALFRNVPVDPTDPKKGRRFEDVTAKAGLDKGIEWATSAAFADLDGDGRPRRPTSSQSTSAWWRSCWGAVIPIEVGRW
jgi:hypothetical protein